MSRGRSILRLVAGATAIGGFAMDWNRTHLFNPAWPPHARFHNAQTITLGTLLGSAGLVALHGQGKGSREKIAAGALLPAFFWASMGAAFFYPGTGGLQSEFPDLVPHIKGVWIDERFASVSMLGLGVLGYVLERRSVTGGDASQESKRLKH